MIGVAFVIGSIGMCCCRCLLLPFNSCSYRFHFVYILHTHLLTTIGKCWNLSKKNKMKKSKAKISNTHWIQTMLCFLLRASLLRHIKKAGKREKKRKKFDSMHLTRMRTTQNWKLKLEKWCQSTQIWDKDMRLFSIFRTYVWPYKRMTMPIATATATVRVVHVTNIVVILWWYEELFFFSSSQPAVLFGFSGETNHLFIQLVYRNLPIKRKTKKENKKRLPFVPVPNMLLPALYCIKSKANR